MQLSAISNCSLLHPAPVPVVCTNPPASVYWNALWKSYLVYSVLFVIVRFLAVLLVASTIRDASQKPLKFIYKVASANWNVELTRFSKHIRTGGLALSGRGLFYFTRQLILTVKKWDAAAGASALDGGSSSSFTVSQ